VDSLKKRHFHRALARIFDMNKASSLAAPLHEAYMASGSADYR
jgi:hypothetical protein